jgi:hypothetical protein
MPYQIELAPDAKEHLLTTVRATKGSGRLKPRQEW